MIRNIFKRFARQESGAVTVDWVVLTAAVVALAAGIGTVLVDTSATGITGTLKKKITDTITAVGA